MSWHDINKSHDGVVCSVHDSKAWKHVDTTWLDVATNLHNIRLGLVLDGMNLNVVFFLNYNLPPWLTTKWFFIQLALLILGKELV